METTNYYLDYRTGELVKDLDTRTLAPEEYIEIIVDDNLDGVYKYTLEDDQNKRLDFSFNGQSVLTNSDHTLDELIEEYCKVHKFNKISIVKRELFLSKENFDKLQFLAD